MDPYKQLELLLPQVMSPDRYGFRKELKRLLHKSRKNKSGTEDKNKLLRLKRKISFSIQKKEWRKKNIPAFSYIPELPITAKKDEIIEAIRTNNIVIISGETGSGKTTQLPKFCLAAGRGINGIIGCTQPRRIAAISIANRIAEELGEEVGSSVGYKIRFDEKTGENSFIKIMTDGILLAETAGDPYLNAYDTIIVDEAHERSINIDFILGILKRLLARRRDLKLIVTSATIDTDKFSKAFNNAPVIEVSGKMYPVEVRYTDAAEDAENIPADYIEQAADVALSLLREDMSFEHKRSSVTVPDTRASCPSVEHKQSSVTVLDTRASCPSAGYKRTSCPHPALGHPCPSGGDILIFMPTELDIRETCDLLQKKNKYNFAVFPLYSRLPAGQQKQIFSPISKRKIIVSTNIAETSLTIPNISYVIDTGLARMSEYSPTSGIVSMPIKAISGSSADQRMGRCGRVREGVCIRLYAKEDYEGRDRFTKPEIFRTNLAEVILKMTALRLGDISLFPFIDKPKQQAITDGYNTLIELGAIRKEDNSFSLTDRGRIMAALPVDPRLSRMLIEAGERKCMSEVLAIASMLSVQDPRERPPGKENEADKKHAAFTDRSSDFITLLNIWNKFTDLYNDNASQNKIRKFCRENFISYNRMKDIREIHAQLSGTLEENGLTLKKAVKKKHRFIKEYDLLYNAIHKSILTGFLSNIANKKTNNLFIASKQREVVIFPGSGLFGRAKDWIVCAELVKTSLLFARTAANIKPDWLEELAGDLCEYSYRDPYWDREKGDVYASEQVTLYGLEIIRNRRVLYGRKNPEEACKVFIRDALIEDMFTEIGLDGTAYAGKTAELFQLGREFQFLQHNVELIKNFMRIEKRIRKKILISRDDLYMFYADHIHDAYNIGTLDSLIKKNRNDDFLCMNDEDMLSSLPDYNKLKEYPETISINNITLDLLYKFNPGSEDDGITLIIPVSVLQSININLIESAIPGLYREKITELIKNLPKQYRRYFIPAADSVEKIIREMPKGNPMIASLQKFIYEKYNIEIPNQEWPPEKLPDHLRLKLSIRDKNGIEITSGKDAGNIIRELTEKYKARAFNEIKNKWEKEDIREWDFGDLPEEIKTKNENGLQFVFYPGLRKENGKLSLRIFMDMETAAGSHKEAVAELTAKELSGQLNIIKNELDVPDELKSAVMLFGGLSSIREQYHKRMMSKNFYKDIRSKQDFINNIKMMRESLREHGVHLRLLLIDVLENYTTATDKLGILKLQNKAIKPNLVFLNKIKDELNILVPRDFLLVYDDNELASLGKYIKALAIRAERGCANLQKDIQKEKEILLFKDALDHEYNILTKTTSNEKKKALRTFFWLIEEYKISVFAPEIKSGIKISGKRLEQVLEEIRKMN
ncbi:MAG: ATP-dependent RNA helicase HrpA [Spirochaetota bacterium]